MKTSAIRCLFFLLSAVLMIVTVTVQASETITIEGTGDSQALLRQLAKEFSSAVPDIQVIVPDSIGTGGGIRAVAENKATLGRTARPLKADEKAQGLAEYLFAQSPVVMAAHPSLAQVRSLTSTDLINLYSGTHKTWDVFGGPPQKIYLIDREPGDSSRGTLEKNIQGFDSIKSIGKMFYNTPSAVEAIARHSFSAGYIPLAWARNQSLHIIALNGVLPSDDAIKRGAYPLVTPFYVISHEPVSDTAKLFIDFLYSDAARRVMRESGVVPVGQ